MITGKTIGQLTQLNTITPDTLIPVEFSGSTYYVSHSILTSSSSLSSRITNLEISSGSFSTRLFGLESVTSSVSGNTLISTNAIGAEGGEIQLAKAPTSTLSGSNVIIDQYADRIRFFEGGGNARGAYIDLSTAPAGVGFLINNRASGIVNAGVDVTLGNLKARIPTSGNRSLQISTVSGTYSVYGSDTYSQSGTIAGSTIQDNSPRSISTTPAYLNAGYHFGAAGATDTWVIMDTSNTIAWRITMIVGSSYNNNMISIERLV